MNLAGTNSCFGQTLCTSVKQFLNDSYSPTIDFQGLVCFTDDIARSRYHVASIPWLETDDTCQQLMLLFMFDFLLESLSLLLFSFFLILLLACLSVVLFFSLYKLLTQRAWLWQMLKQFCLIISLYVKNEGSCCGVHFYVTWL